MPRVISISGVDGVGKSTVINQLVKDLKSRGLFPKVIRSRPCGFPILSSVKYGRRGAEQHASEQLHSEKIPHKSMVSYLKFIYYLLDYCVGWVSVGYWLRSNKTVIIFDRYYFDYICDQGRFSMVLNPKFVKYFLNVLLIPDCNIYLRASVERIYERRREQTENQIITSNNQYVTLFEECKIRYPTKSFCIIQGLEVDTYDEVLKCVHG
jgi:thymidylate kinase